MPSRIPSRPCRVHSSVINHPCRRFFGAPGLPSRSAYPLLYLSFLFVVVCLMAITIGAINWLRKSRHKTPLKTLRTLAFVGVSQPHYGDTSIDHRDVSDGGQGRRSQARRPRPGTP